MESTYLAKDFDAYASDGYCAERYQGVGETRPHWHSGYEIIYMEKGESIVFFGNKWFTLGETDALIIPVGSIHCWRCYDTYYETNSNCNLFWWLKKYQYLGIIYKYELQMRGD